MNLKKIFSISNILIALIICSLVLIASISAKDYFMTPENKLYTALDLMRQNKPHKAERYFLMASKSDNTLISKLSSYYLGNLYLKGDSGFNKNPQKAEAFLEKSALLGSTRAAYELALLYDIGDQIPENRDKAIIYMIQAAEAGNPDALYAMGVWAERGYMDDVPFGKIVKVYEMAAEKGHVNAMKSLIAIYKNGYGEFPYNIERAHFWMQKLKEKENKGK